MLRLFSSSHLAIITTPVASVLFATSAPVALTYAQSQEQENNNKKTNKTKNRLAQKWRWSRVHGVSTEKERESTVGKTTERNGCHCSVYLPLKLQFSRRNQKRKTML